jgi:hypothetical protein
VHEVPQWPAGQPPCRLSGSSRDAVAAQTATYSKLYSFVRPALVNGTAGAVVAARGRVLSVMAFTVTNGRIAQIDALVDPQRLAQLDLRLSPIADEQPLN